MRILIYFVLTLLLAGSVASADIFIQNKFSDNTTVKNITYTESGNYTLYVDLPKYAGIYNAKIRLDGLNSGDDNNILDFNVPNGQSNQNFLLGDYVVINGTNSVKNIFHTFGANIGWGYLKLTFENKTISETTLAEIGTSGGIEYLYANLTNISWANATLRVYYRNHWASTPYLSALNITLNHTNSTHGVFAVGLDTANNNNDDWIYTGIYNTSSLIDMNSTAINLYLRSCNPDGNGLCKLPLVFESQSEGSLELDINNTINFTDYRVDEMNYSSQVMEGETTDYYLRLITSPNISSVTAYLNRNDTSYSVTATETSYGTYNYFEFTETLLTPLIVGSQSNITVPLNWSFTLTYSNSSQINDTSDTYNQSVYRIALTDCSAGSLSQTVTLNFTQRDEESQDIMTADYEATFNISVLGGITKSFNFSGTNVDTWAVCIFPLNQTLSMNGIIQYDNGTDTVREYYFYQAEINNQTQYIDLYTLSSDLTDIVKFTIVDLANSPIENAIMHIQRYYINEDAYLTVAMIKTNSLGKDQTFLRGSDTFYRFLIQQDGTTIGELAPSKIPIDPINLEADLAITIDPEALGSIYNFIGNIAFSCTYNNITHVIRCTISDASGLGENSQLIVIKQGLLTRTVICDSTVESVSTTHTCSLGSIINGTYYYQFFVILEGDTRYLLESGLVETGTATAEYGETGIFMALFLLLIMLGIGSQNPTVGIVAGLITTGFSVGVGLVPALDVHLLSLVAGGAFLIYLMRT